MADSDPRLGAVERGRSNEVVVRDTHDPGQAPFLASADIYGKLRIRRSTHAVLLGWQCRRRGWQDVPLRGRCRDAAVLVLNSECLLDGSLYTVDRQVGCGAQEVHAQGEETGDTKVG